MPRCPNCDAPVPSKPLPTPVAEAAAQETCDACGGTFAEAEALYEERDIELLPFTDLDEAEVPLEELLF